jgi:hypothetical protein
VFSAGFVRQKRGKKVPSFMKQKVASSFAFFLANEPGTDVRTMEVGREGERLFMLSVWDLYTIENGFVSRQNHTGLVINFILGEYIF